MMYRILTVKGYDYKLRLNARCCVDLERKLGRNPVGVFADAATGEMPKLTDVLCIFHQCLQPYHHDVTIDKAYDIFDDMVDDGHGMTELIELLLDVMKDSGLISAPEEDQEDGAESPN